MNLQIVETWLLDKKVFHILFEFKRQQGLSRQVNRPRHFSLGLLLEMGQPVLHLDAFLREAILGILEWQAWIITLNHDVLEALIFRFHRILFLGLQFILVIIYQGAILLLGKLQLLLLFLHFLIIHLVDGSELLFQLRILQILRDAPSVLDK